MTLTAALRHLLDALTRHHWELRSRLLALSMLPVFIFAIVWGAYVIHQRTTDLQSQLQQRAQLLARQMAAAADYGIFSRNLVALQNLTVAVSKEPSVIAATLYDVNQNVLANNRATGAATGPQTIDIKALISQSVKQGHIPISTSTAHRIAYIEPVRSPTLTIDDLPEAQLLAPHNNVAGYAVVEITSEAVATEIVTFSVTVFGLLAGVLFLNWGIVRKLSSGIDNRVQAVAHAVLQIGQGRAGIRLGPNSITVFDRLAQDINRMSERLEQSRSDLEQRVEHATAALREQRDTAERANSAKTRFLAAASHDLRQPMHALSLLLAALKQEQSTELREELLLRIEAATHAMSSLLDGLLDISRLDAGGIQPHEETFELLPMLLRMRDTYEPLAQRKGIDFHIRPSRLWVRSDPTLLMRIVGNFVANAIRYTPSGGRIMVAARQRGEHCLLQVRDNGPGIEPKYQQAIFEEFIQIHNPQRDRSEGLGLGLAIVQRLANLLNHAVELRSCPLHGATFAIRVPIREPMPSVSDVAADQHSLPIQLNQPIALHGYRILLVEDDALVRESYERLLNLWGCDIRAHSNASAALSQVSEGNWLPQIIISDYRLGGGVNGLELITAVRQHLRQQVPAALITGNTEEPALRKLNENACRVLFKPVKPVLLMQTLHELLLAAPATPELER